MFLANDSISAGEDPSTASTKWDRIADCYQDESTLGITEFDKAFFAIKVPPVDRISFSFLTDTTKNFNNIQGRVFRFCHRYQYFDNSYSVCSAHSDITLSTDNELYNGIATATIATHNYIRLNFSLYSSALVKNIEIFFQELDGDWKRMTVINRRDQTLLATVNGTFDFYNNDNYSVIDQTIPYLVYDAVPRLASAQEIINKNIFCYAGCTEGFDNIDKDIIDVTLTPVLQHCQQYTEQSNYILHYQHIPISNI